MFYNLTRLMSFVDEIIWEAKLCPKDQQKSRSANREQTKYYGKHKEYMVYCVTESVKHFIWQIFNLG